MASTYTISILGIKGLLTGGENMTMDAEIKDIGIVESSKKEVGVVLLSTSKHERVLPIFVNISQAKNIHEGLSRDIPRRPDKHDLLHKIIQKLNGELKRVVISDFENSVYVSEIHLDTPLGERIVDARPSDALAVAVRTASAIEIVDAVFEETSRMPEEVNLTDSSFASD